MTEKTFRINCYHCRDMLERFSGMMGAPLSESDIAYLKEQADKCYIAITSIKRGQVLNNSYVNELLSELLVESDDFTIDEIIEHYATVHYPMTKRTMFLSEQYDKVFIGSINSMQIASPLITKEYFCNYMLNYLKK